MTQVDPFDPRTWPAWMKEDTRLAGKLSDLDEEPTIAVDDTAVCARCTEGLVVRSVRTGRQFHGPFWQLAWTHVDPQPGTDGTRCWAPPAQPDPATFRRGIDYERPASLQIDLGGVTSGLV